MVGPRTNTPNGNTFDESQRRIFLNDQDELADNHEFPEAFKVIARAKNLHKMTLARSFRY